MVRQQLQIWEWASPGRRGQAFCFCSHQGYQRIARAIPSQQGFLQQVPELLWGAGSSSGSLLPPRALLQAEIYLGQGLFSPCSSRWLPQTILFLPREDPEIKVCYICCKAVTEPGLLPIYTT